MMGFTVGFWGEGCDIKKDHDIVGKGYAEHDMYRLSVVDEHPSADYDPMIDHKVNVDNDDHADPVINRKVVLENNSHVDVVGYGTVKLQLTAWNVLTLKNVFHMPATKPQEGRFLEPTKAGTKARQIHPPHKNTKSNLVLDKRKFKPPAPMTTPVEKRNVSKFCEFHGEVGHTSDKCMQLKRQIKEMLKARNLLHLIKELKKSNGKDRAKAAKKGEARGKEKPPAILMAVPSIAHEMLKFLVTGGTVTLQSNRIIPLECTIVSGPEVPQSIINKVTKENIQVAIHPEYPKKTIAIGSTLTEEGQKELCSLLRCNLDIFAWKPADMTGIPRHVAEHRKAGGRWHHERSPLSQLAINPVMVKKHDGSWRTCVDFKDLNKACPKDGYPLPEIDWKVESLCRYPFKCFLDAYKGYNQMKMAKEDEEKTAFITRTITHLCKQVLVEELKETLIDEKEVLAVVEEEGRTWMTHIHEYLVEEILREEKKKARAVRRKAKRECNDCQVHCPVPRNSQPNLAPITSPWLFYKWGIDIAGPFPEGPGKVKFLIVAIDYFTKWIEAKPLATITGAQIKKATHLKIGVKSYASVNALLPSNIHKPLAWWKGEQNFSNREIPFSLTYGMEAVILVEIGMLTLRTTEVDMIKNDEALGINLDLLEEKREKAVNPRSKMQSQNEKYYNVKVHNTSFRRIYIPKQRSKPCERRRKAQT
uniref:Reverse transcriptase domain-containing protein n=1 Tax=Tanacetum cinerariifolium TaxID=118510 RepID=A0A6L2P4E7_TANCI|nr:reverse transcriptase domain-containing protein [Tanacetum cinerariifolium]